MAAFQASLSFSISWSLLKFMFIELVMLSNLVILCRPCLLPPSIFSSIRVFSNESALHIRRPKYWSSSFSIRSSNEYSELYFLSDWLVWSSCCPSDSQESSPTPQFESINSLALSLLCRPPLTSIHDYCSESLCCYDGGLWETLPHKPLVVFIKNVINVGGILLSNKKEGSIDMCNNVNELQSNYAK